MNIIDGQVTKNFNLNEIKCNHCGDLIVNEKVIDHLKRLQAFRDWYNRPININSGYRCKTHNTNVGGASNSFHMKGIATDFSLPSEFYKFSTVRKEEFISNILNYWYSLGGGSIGIYDTFIHLDSKGGKFIIYDNRKNKNYKLGGVK